jgi:ArsR family transcriptional regulator, lead/cadmium/zinc/bismuth-responsive transcriptional repressor
MTDDRAVEIAEVFRLLGDPTRLRVILACLNEAKAVGDIAIEVGVSQSLTSHHLRLLRAARLVRGDRHGREIHYTAADEHVRCILADMIDHVGETEHMTETRLEAV